jgi:hypothetical protein
LTPHSDTSFHKLLHVVYSFAVLLIVSLLSLLSFQVAIHSTRASLPFVQEIREVQLNLRLDGLATVDAREFCSSPDDDLPDELHLSTRAQCSLGQAMAERYVSLAKAL